MLPYKIIKLSIISLPKIVVCYDIKLYVKIIFKKKKMVTLQLVKRVCINVLLYITL